jgi:hypothetical protein
MKYLLTLCLLTLGGCIATSKYPATCDITQPDKQGPGYTVGTFPCSLTHHEGKEKP